MKITLAGLSELAVCAGFSLPAPGADDVTKPACFNWFRQESPPPRTSGYFAVQAQQPCCPQPVCNACPQTTCTQQYTLQSRYQSVTTMQTQTNYEPVTVMQSSYYYEPVVTVRSYYCPNSCSYKQAAETSYVLKEKSCPVQSYVAKSVQVPVTTCQKVYYYQPQTVCTQSPPPCCPVAAVPQTPCCQPGGSPPVNPPQVTGTPGGQDFKPPIVTDKQYSDKQYYKDLPRGETVPPPPGNGNGNGGTSWQPVSPPQPAPAPPAQSFPQAHTVKLDRIVFGSDSLVEGEVVRGDKSPRSDARMLFVNANQPSQRQTVTANHNGRFQLTLAAGGWLVYIYNLDGDAVFHSRIEVGDDNVSRIVLVNR